MLDVEVALVKVVASEANCRKCWRRIALVPANQKVIGAYRIENDKDDIRLASGAGLAATIRNRILLTGCDR